MEDNVETQDANPVSQPKEFLTLDDLQCEGKAVLVRIDINSAITSAGKIQDSERFEAHAETIRELAKRKANRFKTVSLPR